ncbi:MAG: redoxin domain-containing protein [Solirubrobacteraceae bacterium]
MRIGPGDAFADLTLTDHAERTRSLAELAAGDPLLLTTYRGFWCPKEQAFFRRLLDLQSDAEVAYTAMASLSVDPPPVAAAFRAGLGARWTFLCDPERRHLDALGLRETTDTLHRPYQPAVFVLGPDLVVRSAYDGYWFWGRPGLDELRRDLRAVTRAIRRDWEVPR